MEEYFDIADEQGNPTGNIVERSIAHAYGIRHRTSHVWLARFAGGRPQLLLQKRCTAKDSYPGCYDISSAGHIPAGVDYLPSALRELKEELGVDAVGEELELLGSVFESADSVFNGREFHDREFANVYLMFRSCDESSFSIQPEELESVLWMDLEEILRRVEDGSLPNCIHPSELKLLSARLSNTTQEHNK